MLARSQIRSHARKIGGPLNMPLVRYRYKEAAIRVDSVKEYKVQEALGIRVVMCEKCVDKGIYRDISVYDRDDFICSHCTAGWFFTWKNWLDLGHSQHKLTPCSEHPDYTGEEQPKVLCERCWKIRFAAPQKDGEFIDNFGIYSEEKLLEFGREYGVTR